MKNCQSLGLMLALSTASAPGLTVKLGYSGSQTESEGLFIKLVQILSEYTESFILEFKGEFRVFKIHTL